jgi:tetratricopeptide (TPR) repeat protein
MSAFGCQLQIVLTALAEAEIASLIDAVDIERPLSRSKLEQVAHRSGGNPQFALDLAALAKHSSFNEELPESAEAAALARLDALPEKTGNLLRQLSVLGSRFHPDTVPWLGPEVGRVFAAGLPLVYTPMLDVDHDGFFCFLQPLLRDAAYATLSFKSRRRLHAAVAANMEKVGKDSSQVAATLSLHYEAAGNVEQTWRYAHIAAKSAEEAYAFVEAANLYQRALAAAATLATVSRAQHEEVALAQAWAWYRADEFRKALDAYAAVRKRFLGDRLVEAQALLKLSIVEHKIGGLQESMRWAEEAHGVLEHDPSPEARRLAIKANSWRAVVLKDRGRAAEALQLAEQTIREASEVHDTETLAESHYVIGCLLGIAGDAGAEAAMLVALEASRQCGNRAWATRMLSTLGNIQQWQGRWDEAMRYYEEAREESRQTGNVVDEAIFRLNIAEILIDRGELEEAEATLRQTMLIWKSAEYRFFLGVCHLLLGRLSLRAGRASEALWHLDQARAIVIEVGAEPEAIEIDVRRAEGSALQGRAETALAIANETFARTDMTEVVAKLSPVLYRICGYALSAQGKMAEANAMLEQGLVVARERKDRFEILLSLHALRQAAKAQNRPIPESRGAELDQLTRELRIVKFPVTPLDGALAPP